jgi:hypothetical protein
MGAHDDHAWAPRFAAGQGRRLLTFLRAGVPPHERVNCHSQSILGRLRDAMAGTLDRIAVTMLAGAPESAASLIKSFQPHPT